MTTPRDRSLPAGTGVAVLVFVVALIVVVIFASRLKKAERPTLKPTPAITVVTITHTNTP